MKKAFFYSKIMFVIFGLLLFQYTIAQDSKTITGLVTDESTGEPLPGVSVVIKGTTQGTATNFNGEYSMEANAGDLLVYSFVGYLSREIKVGDETSINVQLAQDVVGLDEVVVIGYGQVKKGDATGSVTAVSAEDFNKGAITSPQELFMGKTAGVVITTDDGAPGAGAKIRIRGGSSLNATNDPLIVIDGFPVTNDDIGGLSNPLNVINPNDIETITVLKDASATAIYGSRASNGVIIITTKKGSSDQLRVNYNGNVSMGTPTKYLDVLNGDEFRAVVEDRVANHNLNADLTRLGDASTDWQKEIYENAISTDHNLSVAGALQGVPFRASAGYTIQNGILKYSGIDRATLGLNVSPSFFNDHLKLDINAKGMNIQTNFSNTDAISSAVEFDPTQPVRNGNTRFGGYTAWVDLSDADQLNGLPNNIATHNPVARLEFRDNTSDAIRSIGSFKADYKFHYIPELHATLNLGYDYYKSTGSDNTDPLASWSYREPSQNVKGYEHVGNDKLLDFYLNYVKDVPSISSRIDITAGHSWQHFHREGFDSNRPWEATDGVFVGADTIEYKNEYYLLSFFGRLNYTLLDRYIVTATLRNDGSSRFAKENRWGLFPSIAVAWKLNNEAFLNNVEAITEMKLRLGYGVTGQQDISDNKYPYLPIYTISQQGAYYQFGDAYYPTWRPGRYDAGIQWEETTTTNIGLDFGILNGRISGSVDFYERVTDNLINEIPIAAGTNFSNFLVTNVGSLENRGYEVALNFFPVSTSNVSWEFGVNLSYNENKITKLTRVEDPNYTGYEVGEISGGVGNKVQINNTGFPANTFFLFKQVYDEDGMPIEGLYVDKTGLGGAVEANNANKYYMKNPRPDYLAGISSRVSYKDFDLSFSGRLSIGNYVYNNNASNRAVYQNVYLQSGFYGNIPKSIQDTEFATAQYWSDFYLEDGSFFRMDNITLGYNFLQLLTERLSGRISFTVQNAFVITEYSGIDPEVESGIDRNIYPRPRTFLLGINVDF